MPITLLQAAATGDARSRPKSSGISSSSVMISDHAARGGYAAAAGGGDGDNDNSKSALFSAS